MRCKLPRHTSCVFDRIQGLDLRSPTLRGTPIQECRIRLLDMPRIAQHDVGQVRRRRGGEDRTFIALFDQVGQIAAMIQMGVGEDDRVEVVRRKGEIPIPLLALSPAPLEQAAVQQDCLSVDAEQMLRSGHGLGGPVKGKLHGGFRHALPLAP